MTRDELLTARTSLQNLKETVNTLLRDNRFQGFNSSFHERCYWKNPYHESSEREEQAFAVFSNELVSEVSKGTAFWASEGCHYTTLREWCLGECNSHQEQVYFAIHFLTDDIATVAFLLERCEA